MNEKVWYTSKTLWVNGLTIVGLAFGLLGVDVGLDDETKGEIAAGVVALANFVLRVVTASQLKWKGDNSDA